MTPKDIETADRLLIDRRNTLANIERLNGNGEIGFVLHPNEPHPSVTPIPDECTGFVKTAIAAELGRYVLTINSELQSLGVDISDQPTTT